MPLPLPSTCRLLSWVVRRGGRRVLVQLQIRRSEIELIMRQLRFNLMGRLVEFYGNLIISLAECGIALSSVNMGARGRRTPADLLLFVLSLQVAPLHELAYGEL